MNRAVCLGLLWLVGCGEDGGAPPKNPARYQTFDVAILSPAPGGVLRPGQQLSYEIHTNAELFFEVRIEDETCKSTIIRVPSTGPKM